MRVLNVSELGRRAQQVMRDDPRGAALLGVQEGDELHIYRLILPRDGEPFEHYYSPWVKIVPETEARGEQYRLYHQALSSHWQQLEIAGTLEFCVRQILENRYHLFWG